MDERVRLLLIEFAATRGFHRAELFPFVQGRLRPDHATRWIRFGVAPANLLQFEAEGVDLDAADTATLQRALDAFAPTHVLFGLRPAAGLLARLAMPGCVRDLRHAGPDAAATGDAPSIPCLWNAPRPFPTPDTDVSRMARLSGAVPDHAWEPGNDAARALNPLPYVIAGESCLYERSFASNPFLAGLDLDGCVRAGGCAFCLRPPAQPDAWRDVDPVRSIQVQFDAIARTCPRAPDRLWIRMQGDAPVRRVEAVADILRDAALPPSDLLLDCRSDLLVRSLPAFRRALATLAGTPHRIELCLVGVENFAGPELARLNKGFGPATNLEALRALFLLEREFPDGFGFRRHGGLSLITFTPWTRPEELLLNLSVCELLGIAPIAGKLLSGRLRLYAALPLHARARADGLLADRYDDPLLDTARLNLYEPEVPWRFADPVMEPIGRVLLRIENDQVPRGFDALTDAVADVVHRGRKGGVSPVDVARHVVREAVALAWEGGIPDVDALVAEADRFVARRVDPGPAGEYWAPLPTWPVAGPQTDLIVPLDTLLALKPVTKVEPVHPDSVAAWTGNPLLPNVRAERRPLPDGREDAFEAFFGLRAADVDEAVAVTMRMHDPATPPGERPALIARMGRLLGYPACCADAWAAEDEPFRDSVFWMHVDRRIATPGPVPWEVSPASLGIEYVPCSLDCAPSLPRARRVLDALRQAAPAVWERHVARLQRPFLLFAGVQSAIVELIPESEPGERFRYRVGHDMVPCAETAGVTLSDEIVAEGETLLLLRQGRPFLPLSGRAFLWWHGRAIQADFWRAMIAARRAAPIQPPAPPPRDTVLPSPESADPAAARAASFLERLFAGVARGPTRFAGYRLADSGPAGPGQVAVRLEGGDRPVRLVVDVREQGATGLARIGRMSVRHPEDAPLRTPDQWRAFHAFMRFLRDLRARRGPGPGDA